MCLKWLLGGLCIVDWYYKIEVSLAKRLQFLSFKVNYCGRSWRVPLCGVKASALTRIVAGS